MTVTVVMYEKSWDHIGVRLKALDLDISVVTFNRNGQFLIDGKQIAPADVAVDYFWLSAHLNYDRALQTAFDTVLACQSVGVLQTFNAGLDNPFYREAANKGIRICNSSAQGVAIAEYVMAQVLSILHPIERQRTMQANREWTRTPFRELSRTNWLIVGYGPIGREVAKRVKAFGASTTVVRRTPSTSEIVDKSGTLGDLATFLQEADVIVLACPLNDTTRGLAGEEFFGAIKDDAILVNIARGGLIDDASLISALDESRLECAVLDVFHTEPLPEDDPLWSHPKVRLTPHTSFAGDGVQLRWDQLFLDNIGRYSRGEPLTREVDPKDI
jgi:phosphoglycerate dehydrogenase-like enzyme